MNELKRCMKVGGRALISVWDYAQPRFRSSFERQIYSPDDPKGSETFGDVTVPWKSPGGRVSKRFYHLFIEEEFRALVDSIGFKETKFFSESGNHFAVVIR